MNLKQFRYVLLLAREGSFSKAADALSIKQPSFSKYIKNIEQEIGMELFDRSGGNLRLTDAGRAYIEAGREMLALEHRLEEQLADLVALRSGTLTVGLSAHRSKALMPGIVKAFRECYPGVILKIDERKRAEIIEAAEHGEFDLCLTTLPVDTERFCYETVMVEENVIAVPAGITLEAEAVEERLFPAVPVRSLQGMEFAMLNEEHPMQHELNALCSKYGLSILKTVECTGLEALWEMVAAGIGAAFIPSCLATPNPAVRYYSIREETNKREIVLAYRKEQYLSNAVLALMRIIKETLLHR